MKIFALFLTFLTSIVTGAIKPESVAVIYNDKLPESKELAEYYAKARQIPADNLIGLPLLDQGEINRNYYNKALRNPLRKIFTDRHWWELGQEVNGVKQPKSCRISTIICMRGVPFKIKRIGQTTEQKAAGEKVALTEASVDSELSILGIHEPPLHGIVKNPYYEKDSSIDDAGIPEILLVGRIDASDYNICKRMIDDSIATERTGLWGMSYLDFALKGKNYQLGDQWLENIAKINHNKGIPTVTDRNKQTFTTNYPMDDCAVYFGWYAKNSNGPLLNPDFRFRQGAIATHLHSFSARDLRHTKKNWCGPILAHGAAATLGTVYEPYLHFVHHYDIFYDRLINGYSLIEASYMATPALSWQNVTLGDPLYRPFLHLDGSGEKQRKDRDYRAIRLANSIWSNEPETLITKLETAAEAKNKGKIFEYLGLRYRHQKDPKKAIQYFKKSGENLLRETDRLRQLLYIADTQRHTGNKTAAIKTLQHTLNITGNIPELLSAKALLNILSPPPPAQIKKKKAKLQ